MPLVFVPNEAASGETRVSITPDAAKRLIKGGFTVTVAAGAGAKAHFVDSAYNAAGCTVLDGAEADTAMRSADVVTRVSPIDESDAAKLRDGAVLVGFIAPHKSARAVKVLRDRNVSTLSMELVPRISRAQSMDALSSQASIAGYKAVLLAASNLDKYFPLLMTAAGTIQPARVVIMGAGVAGLQAIATAKRLGAIVEVSDVRPAVKEQVESLGGRFIDIPLEESGEGQGGYARELTQEQLKAQQAMVHERVIAADVVITTALVPGRAAPRLITADMVKSMRAGAIIIDMAVEQGGNCELSKMDETVVAHGVTIIGAANLPATIPADSSLLYARNVQTLLALLMTKGEFKLDLDDEIIAGALLTHKGEVRHAPTRDAVAALQ